MEGGVGALALASGQAASAIALQNLARAGDNVVSSTDLYGGTWNLFANTLKDQGLQVRFVDPIDPNNFRRATDDRTRAYMPKRCPTRSSRCFRLPRWPKSAAVSGFRLLWTIQRRRSLPAHSSMERRSLFIRQQNISAGTAIRSAASLSMAAISTGPHTRRQPALNTPDPSYHGAVWTEAVKPLGPIAYIIKARVTLLRDIGSSMSPFNAFLILQGCRDGGAAYKHCENTQAG